jgi:hypothetical protein
MSKARVEVPMSLMKAERRKERKLRQAAAVQSRPKFRDRQKNGTN